MSTFQPRVKGRSFSHPELAFALAWEVYAPGLGGWTVTPDEGDDGAIVLLVDPPLVCGDGFELRPDADGVLITSSLGQHRAPTLRDALLLICPLSPAALGGAERLAAAPEVGFFRLKSRSDVLQAAVRAILASIRSQMATLRSVPSKRAISCSPVGEVTLISVR